MVEVVLSNRWLPGEPDDDECASVTKSRTGQTGLTDENCDRVLQFICMRNAGNLSPFTGA